MDIHLQKYNQLHLTRKPSNQYLVLSMVPYPAPPPALVPHPAPPPLSHSTPEDWEKYGLREGLARGCAERRGGRRRRRRPPPCAAAPRPLQRGVREKMREIRYDRTPRTAAASPSPPPSSTVRFCRHSPRSAPPHRSRRGRVRESRDQGRERSRGKRETGEGGTDLDLGV